LIFIIFNPKGRDEMLLIKVNMIKKKLIQIFLETTEEVSKASRGQKT